MPCVLYSYWLAAHGAGVRGCRASMAKAGPAYPGDIGEGYPMAYHHWSGLLLTLDQSICPRARNTKQASLAAQAKQSMSPAAREQTGMANLPKLRTASCSFLDSCTSTTAREPACKRMNGRGMTGSSSLCKHSSRCCAFRSIRLHSSWYCDANACTMQSPV